MFSKPLIVCGCTIVFANKYTCESRHATIRPVPSAGYGSTAFAVPEDSCRNKKRIIGIACAEHKFLQS